MKAASHIQSSLHVSHQRSSRLQNETVLSLLYHLTTPSQLHQLPTRNRRKLDGMLSIRVELSLFHSITNSSHPLPHLLLPLPFPLHQHPHRIPHPFSPLLPQNQCMLNCNQSQPSIRTPNQNHNHIPTNLPTSQPTLLTTPQKRNAHVVRPFPLLHQPHTFHP